MAAKQEILDYGLVMLTTGYAEYVQEKETNNAVTQLLTQLNQQLGTVDDLPLAEQNDEFKNMVFKLIQEQQKEKGVDSFSLIYAHIKEELDRKTHQAQEEHRKQGNYSSKPLHKRMLEAQMEDHDITRIMPKETPTTQIFAAMDRFDAGFVALAAEEIQKFTQHPHTQHAIIPIGPGHWRGLYLSKPQAKEAPYQVELFDSYGKEHALHIKDIVNDLMKESHIKNFSIRYTGSQNAQKDSHACGDFVCAYSHQQLQKWEPKAQVNQNLIDTLTHHGNTGNKLREAMVKLSEQLDTPTLKKAVSQTSSPEALSPTGSYNKILPQLDIIPSQHTQENTPPQTTITQQPADSNATKTTGNPLMDEVIQHADQIHQKALEAEKKQPPVRTDEEIAAILQAEELTNAGFKPR